MKIKWKIMIAVTVFVLSVTFFTSISCYKTIKNLVITETKTELKNYSLLGLTLLDEKYPGDWYLDGDKLYKGDTLMNKNYRIVDKLSKDTGILATIFANDTRISTTVRDESGKRPIGTKATDIIINKVLKKHQSYQGSAVVAGKDADAYYVPLRNKTGNVVGMWFVGVYSNEVNNKVNTAMQNTVLPFIIFLIIGLIFSYILGNGISKGIKLIKNNMQQMENGNFKLEFNDHLTKSKDEIGDIARSFLQMQSKIKNIICSIKTETTNIDTSSAILADGANEVNKNVEDISATTEELSAGMEETNASTQEMNATAIEIEKEVSNVASKVKHGQTVTGEIKNRAENLKEVAIVSRNTAADMYEEANKKLRESIEKASAIDEIRSLSQTILDITEQTNLLALNATIESARAGEAGKSFAVVANEISNLADNSKKAVSKIDQISSDLAFAVEDMVSASKNLLQFVDQKVVKDYDILVKTGEQYNEDANTVETMVADIDRSATQLAQSIQYIMNAIDEVTIATTEGATGSSDIAEKSTAILQKTNQVLEQAYANKNIAANLNDMVHFFEI